MDDATLNTIRYCFQRILVPCVVIIGVLGNLITVVVLTRRRMRCSTNIYLTALAIADIIYLLFIFVLSLQHYPNIHHPRYKIYWSTFGLSHWFCDASVYTSVYLTVSFTIERYIAVCHPIRGQVLCTESRAKRVIAAVVILCFLLTISTAFEYQLLQSTEYIDKNTGESCRHLMMNDMGQNQDITNSTLIPKNDTFTTIEPTIEPNVIEELANDTSIYEYSSEITKRDVDTLEALSTNKTSLSYKEMEDKINACQTVYYIYAHQSDFGTNQMYKDIFYIFTSAFGTFVPLILLATFNCFLVAAVHRSHKMRHKMTNTRQSDTSTAQENKVTVTLIAVVVLFLVCQTPATVQLIYTMKAEYYSNMDKAINNLCNFLVTLNAACNFLLYCALSDKYRKTVKQLFLGRKPTRTNTISSSRYHSGQTSTSFCNRSPNISSNSFIRNRNIKSASKKQPKRFEITPAEYANFQETMAKKQARAQSLAAADFITENNKNNNTTIPMLPLAKQSPNNNQYMEDSSSETSLTRASSLVFPPKTKHSPDCKDNPNNF